MSDAWSDVTLTLGTIVLSLVAMAIAGLIQDIGDYLRDRKELKRLRAELVELTGVVCKRCSLKLSPVHFARCPACGWILPKRPVEIKTDEDLTKLVDHLKSGQELGIY